MRKHTAANTKSRRRGATLLEFALIVPIFVLMLLGMLQFGIYLNAAAGVVSLAREGARFSAVRSNADAAVVKNYLSTSGVMPAQLRADRLNGDPAKGISGVVVEYYDSAGVRRGITPGDRLVGGVVKVTINYNMRDKLIFGSGISFSPLNDFYTSSASFQVEL